MAIYRSSDSLVKCSPESYDSLYQVSSHPSIKAQRKQNAKAVDSLEKSAATEALNRLQRPSENMVFQPSILFSRIGKMVFLTVAMPPYFLLYSLPRWILVESAHLLMLASNWLFHQGNNYLKKPLVIALEKTQQLLFFMYQFVVKPVAELAIQLKQFFKDSGQRFWAAFLPVFSFPQKYIKNSLKKGLQPLQTILEKTKDLFEKIGQKTKERLQLFGSKLAEATATIKTPMQLFLGWGPEQFKKIEWRQKSWVRKSAANLKGASELATNYMNLAAQGLKKAILVLKNGVTPIALAYQRFFAPVWSQLKTKIGAQIKIIKEFFQKKKQRFLLFLEGVQKKAKVLTVEDALEKFFPTHFLAKLPLFMRQFLLKLKSSKAMHLVFLGLLNSGRFLVVRASSIVVAVINSLSEFSSKIAQFLGSITHQVTRFTKVTSSYFPSIKQKSKGGLYHFLVFVCMGVILAKWGLEAVAEMNAKWLSKFSLAKKAQLSAKKQSSA